MAGRGAAAGRPTVFAQTPDVGDPRTQRAVDVLSQAVTDLQARALPPILTGTGSPENALAAPVGTLYIRSDGGANTTLYVKESGSDKSGWIAK